MAQGVSGIMSVTGEPGGPPVKSGIPLTDLGAALFAVVDILAALTHRSRTGVGQHVETSLVEAGVALSVWEATEYFAGLGVPGPLGSAHRMVAPYQAVRCATGYITIGMTQALGSPIKLSATPATARRRAPQLGEHTEQVLRDAGFAETEIAELLSAQGAS